MKTKYFIVISIVFFVYLLVISNIDFNGPDEPIYFAYVASIVEDNDLNAVNHLNENYPYYLSDTSWNCPTQKHVHEALTIQTSELIHLPIVPLCQTATNEDIRPSGPPGEHCGDQQCPSDWLQTSPLQPAHDFNMVIGTQNKKRNLFCGISWLFALNSGSRKKITPLNCLIWSIYIQY